MPIFCFSCDSCGVNGVERVLAIDHQHPPCPRCGEEMRQELTAPAMIKIKGEGGYPSRRKMIHGSAPGTTSATKVWGDHDPADQTVNYFGRKEFARQLEASQS